MTKTPSEFLLRGEEGVVETAKFGRSARAKYYTYEPYFGYNDDVTGNFGVTGEGRMGEVEGESDSPLGTGSRIYCTRRIHPSG